MIIYDTYQYFSGRPQRQTYRRSNTSITLGAAENSDLFRSYSNILDKIGSKSRDSLTLSNGTSGRVGRSPNGSSFKEFLLGRSKVGAGTDGEGWHSHNNKQKTVNVCRPYSIPNRNQRRLVGPKIRHLMERNLRYLVLMDRYQLMWDNYRHLVWNTLQCTYFG